MIDLTQFEGHTPGPWEVTEQAPNLCRVYQSTLSGGTVADVARWTWGRPGDSAENLANAKLLAAAPALLAELKRLRMDKEAREELLRKSAEQVLKSNDYAEVLYAQDVFRILGENKSLRAQAAAGERLAEELEKPHYQGHPLMPPGVYEMKSVMVNADWYQAVKQALAAYRRETKEGGEEGLNG